jgi:hypothetical protein
VKAPETDFSRFSLAKSPLGARGRSLLLTVDFEAFDVASLDLWLAAMERWARQAASTGINVSMFIALEDVVRLRHDSKDGYSDFLRQVKLLDTTGVRFYPHNHGLFDPDTGLQAGVKPQTVPGYDKRASFFYDVVHRHGLELRVWLRRLLEHYDEFVEEAGLQRPHQLAFRAGGWDHGSGPSESSIFVNAVSDVGFVYDSSASSGVYGTRTFRVGAPYGSNLLQLTPSLAEVAPCWSFNCGAGLISRSAAGSIRRLLPQPRIWLSRRQEGVFVVVLHFDHLFRPADAKLDSRAKRLASIVRRVDRFFGLITSLRSALGLRSITFDDLELLAVDLPAERRP